MGVLFVCVVCDVFEVCLDTVWGVLGVLFDVYLHLLMFFCVLVVCMFFGVPFALKYLIRLC